MAGLFQAAHDGRTHEAGVACHINPCVLGEYGFHPRDDAMKLEEIRQRRPYGPGMSGLRNRSTETPVVALVQLTLPAYRRLLVRELRSVMSGLIIAAGDQYYDPSVQTGLGLNDVDVPVKNHFFLNRRLACQSRVLKLALGADVSIVELNPRNVSTWLILLAGRMRRRPVIVWGHYLGRKPGAEGPGLGRLLQVRLARRVLAYSAADGDRFRSRFPSASVDVAPNAAERASDVGDVGGMLRTDFVYVGRLVPDKGVCLLVDGFATAVEDGVVPTGSRLVIVGEGPEHGRVEQSARSSGVSDRILLLPETFDSASLNAIYSTAIAGVCGGYVGLNMTQSLCRGVPFIYPLAAAHAPEVSMACAGVNCFPFHPASASALARALGEVSALDSDGRLFRQSIRDHALSTHTIEAMVEGFSSAVARALG